MTMAMAPADVARQVVDAVRMNRFFILTHPEFREVIAERNAALDASFREEADPEKSAAMRSMVRPLD